MFRLLKLMGQVFLVTFDNAVGIPVYIITCILLRPWRMLVPELYWMVESFLFRELMYTVGHWSWLSGVKITEYGDDPTAYVNERCLVLINHQSTADVPVMMAAMCKKFSGGAHLMWIQDIFLKWNHLGLCGQLHGDFFIEEGRERRTHQGELLKIHLQQKYWSRGRNWIVIFPEGGFLYKRLDASQEYARRNNFPVYNFVTLPRIGAVKSVLDTCQSYRANDKNIDGKIRYVIDVTIIYTESEKQPSLWDLIVGTKEIAEDVRIVYKILPAEDVPVEEQPLLKYMYNLYGQKENLLGTFYRTGCKLPKEYTDSGRRLKFSYCCLLLHRIAFISLGFFYVRSFCYILSWLY